MESPVVFYGSLEVRLQFIQCPLTPSVPQLLPSPLKAAVGNTKSRGHTDVITAPVVLYGISSALALVMILPQLGQIGKKHKGEETTSENTKGTDGTDTSLSCRERNRMEGN